MTKNKKLLIGIGIVVLIITGILCIRNRSEKQNVIKVGALSFLTGTYAQMGTDLANGIILAQELYNAGVGDGERTVSLKVEDGKGEGKSAVAAFSRLQQWGVDALIAAGDNQVPTIAPIIVREKIPTVTTIMSNSKALESNSNGVWIFRNWISVTSLAEVMANYAADALKTYRVAILKMHSEFGDEAERAFLDAFSAKGGQVVQVESFGETDVNVKSVVMKTIDSNVDDIYVAGYGICYGIVINQLRECGFKGRILTVDAVMNPETRSQIKDSHDIYFARFIEPSDSKYEIFKTKYEERFGRVASVYSAYGYDAFNILISGFSALSLSKEGVRDALMNHGTYDTLLGALQFKSNGDCSIPLQVQLMSNQPEGKN